MMERKSPTPYLQSVAVGHREAPHLDLLEQTLCFLFWFQNLQYLGKQKEWFRISYFSENNLKKNLKLIFIINSNGHSYLGNQKI